MTPNGQETDAVAQATKPPLRTTGFATDGDVFLVLKRDDFENDLQVRVSSVILSYASSVFAKMLGPQFKEGQAARSASAPAEVHLSGNKSWAMESLCATLHNRSIDVDSEYWAHTPSALMPLAVTADKYGCTQAVKPVGEVYLTRHAARRHKLQGMVYHGLLAAAAYVLELDELFALFTRRLVLDETKTYSVLLKTDCDRAQSACFLFLSELCVIAQDIALVHDFPCGHVNKAHLTPKRLREICEEVSHSIPGFCRMCARLDTAETKCEYKEAKKQTILRDPIFEIL